MKKNVSFARVLVMALAFTTVLIGCASNNWSGSQVIKHKYADISYSTNDINSQAEEGYIIVYIFPTITNEFILEQVKQLNVVGGKLHGMYMKVYLMINSNEYTTPTSIFWNTPLGNSIILSDIVTYVTSEEEKTNVIVLKIQEGTRVGFGIRGEQKLADRSGGQTVLNYFELKLDDSPVQSYEIYWEGKTHLTKQRKLSEVETQVRYDNTSRKITPNDVQLPESSLKL